MITPRMCNYCLLCPNSLICTANGWVPLNIHVDAVTSHAVKGFPCLTYCVSCEAHREGKLGWRPRAVQFDVSEEDMLKLRKKAGVDGPESQGMP